MRKYYEGPSDSGNNVHIRGRYFTFRTEAGVAAGYISNVMFTLDRPVGTVWPYFKDFNRWQPNHYYSGVIGDLEGKSFALSNNQDDLGPDRYQVVRVEPEYLIVIDQPLPKSGRDPHLPGYGRVSPGFHVFMLNQHDGNTLVTATMEHASLMVLGDAATDEEALRPWRAETMAPAWLRKWRDDFIPSLTKLVLEGPPP